AFGHALAGYIIVGDYKYLPTFFHGSILPFGQACVNAFVKGGHMNLTRVGLAQIQQRTAVSQNLAVISIAAFCLIASLPYLSIAYSVGKTFV
ncbi:MAG: hypothetical protein FWD88_05520, partial [Treponema sp.]|nr:hypothetical protein [Treponema sp.]